MKIQSIQNLNYTDNQAALKIAELWSLRDRNPQSYNQCGYGNLKEEMYSTYGNNNKVMDMAKRIYNKR